MGNGARIKALTESFAFLADSAVNTAEDAKYAEGTEVRFNTQSFTKTFAVFALSAVNKIEPLRTRRVMGKVW